MIFLTYNPMKKINTELTIAYIMILVLISMFVFVVITEPKQRVVYTIEQGEITNIDTITYYKLRYAL